MQNESEYYKKYYSEHKEEITARNRKRYADNVDNIRLQKAEYRRKHKKEIALYNAKYIQNNKEKIRAYHRNYRAKHRTAERIKNRARWLMQYALSVQEYDEFLAIQGGTCAICRNPPDGKYGKYLFVDHDHNTGKVRGLLCQSCNFLLGYAKDSTETLLRAIEYLSKID